MIDLITGLPGNGKTLYTISTLKAFAERENRPVYYHGIVLTEEGRSVLTQWVELDDPKNWASVPPGAIVLIDEAQKTFRNRSLGSVPPSHVTDLETHRHLGIDMVLLTQHPSLIDPAVRRLVGRHRHMVRLYGMQAATVHEWAACKDNCDKQRADSEKKKWVYDKAVYRYYKSSELHTVKRSIPGRIKLLVGCLLVLVVAGWYVSSMLSKKMVPAASPAQRSTIVAPAGSSQGGQAAPFDPIADARAYVAMNTPRVEGLPQTAPKYDDLTRPTRVPVPAMCIRRGNACQCYTQQATKLKVQFNQCIDIAHNGYFEEFDADPNKGRGQVGQSAVLPKVASR